MDYNLQGMIIHEEEDGELSFTDHSLGRERVETFWGHAQICGDVLVRGKWKVGDMIDEKKEEVNKRINALPRWTRTKYFIIVADLNVSQLMLCDTGEVINPPPPEVVKALQPTGLVYESTEGNNN